MLQKDEFLENILLLALFQFETVWCLLDLSCDGDFGIDVLPDGYFVAEYCQYNGKCFLCRTRINLESGRKPASKPEVQIRGQVQTGMLDAHRYTYGQFHTIHLATIDILKLTGSPFEQEYKSSSQS